MKPAKSPSLFQLRLRKFRRLKRGYYSFLLLTAAYAFSFLLPFVMSTKALIVHYNGQTYYPGLVSSLHDTFGMYESLGFFRDRKYPAKLFGGPAFLAEADYRKLQAKCRAAQQARDF